jgi:glycosyltransferase involved in cell wall biosynthesis
MVDGKSGVKIAVSNPQETVKAFAGALVRLKAEPEWRASLAAAARVRAKQMFSWAAKRELLEKTYRRLIGHS